MLKLRHVSLILATATGLIACSSGKSGNQVNFSSSSSSNNSTNRDPGLLAQCNGFGVSTLAAGVNATEGAISTYWDVVGQRYVDGYIRIAFTVAPANFFVADHSMALAFATRGFNDSNGQVVSQNSNLNIFIQRKIGGNYLNQTPVHQITTELVRSLMTNFNQGFPEPIFTEANFFSSVILIVTNVAATDDILGVSIWDQAVSGATPTLGPSYAMDVLIPAFASNPRIYNQIHPLSALQALHPNASLLTSAASDQDFLDYTNSFCQRFY